MDDSATKRIQISSHLGYKKNKQNKRPIYIYIHGDTEPKEGTAKYIYYHIIRLCTTDVRKGSEGRTKRRMFRKNRDKNYTYKFIFKIYRYSKIEIQGG